MSNKNEYGVLINSDIKLHRSWFSQMAKLIGIKLRYFAPLESYKNFDLHGDLDSRYYPPLENVFGIFEEHPDQKTLKKMG